MTILTDSQSVALTDLLNALSRCTEVGLFDVVDVAPDIINNFCDVMEECKDDDNLMMAVGGQVFSQVRSKVYQVIK